MRPIRSAARTVSTRLRVSSLRIALFRVLRPDATASAAEPREFLAPTFVRCWLPENRTFLDEVPKTSVGKKDKKRLRALHAAQELAVTRLRTPGAA
jgi:acyl-CoA synthetase (AMP-forming)/AMP-acid ligase II